MVGCTSDEPEEFTSFCDTDTDTGGPDIDGAWSEEVEDWSDPGAQGNESIADPCATVTSDETYAPSALVAHHCFTTGVHAVHMWTGELSVHHGDEDERVWQIGTDPDDMDWHPLPFLATPEVESGGSWVPAISTADLFCAGHVQLFDGRVLFAGGNVTDGPAGGGLAETFVFQPLQASAASDPSPQCPFGWELEDQSGTWTNLSPRMQYDRWYPTLTALGDGRVLISGGTSRIADHTTNPPTFRAVGQAETTRVIELYDPTATPPTIVALDNTEALYPHTDGVPQYPFVFLLPNGDILFAGGESLTNAAQQTGYILVPDYGDVENWAFSAHSITSTINGGSAAMPRPGLVVKSGGPASVTGSATSAAVATTETVDLSGYPAGNYTGAPSSFSTVMDMHHARHFHNMTILPDGRVLATGGNRWGNANTESTGEHYENPCVYEGELRGCESGCEMESLTCSGGCPSQCINWTANVSVSQDCSTAAPQLTCSLIREVSCTPGTQGDADCDDALDGATCSAGGFCTRGCSTEGEDCGLVMGCGVTSPLDGSRCGYANNACYATYAAEIFDPDCGTWTELDAQTYPRMYHSSALLLPDARVISTGGGHRSFAWQVLEEQPTAEYFEPDYAESPSAAGPDFSFGLGSIGLPGNPERYLRWGAEGVDVVVQTAGVTVDHAALIRLGSATHGFDMDQRLLRLPVTGSGSQIHVAPDPAEFHPHTAPPGYYMLFLLSDEGEPGGGLYIRVGDETEASYVCEVSSSFEAQELSCDEEPSSSSCPLSGEVVTPVAAPLVEGPSSTVSGFRVAMPAGVVRDPQNLTSDDVDAIQSLCVEACTAHFASHRGQSANCTDGGVFETPLLVAAEADMSRDFIPDSQRHGEGLFVNESLSCDLGTDCYTSFDESLQLAMPARVTPAQDMVGVGEEWSVTVSGELEADSPWAGTPATAALTGTIGYSQCTEGNASAPCPFYLGSMELEITEPLELTLTCNGQPTAFELEALTIRLGQPAFGIAKKNATMRGFPSGALVLEAEGIVNEVPFSARQPNQQPIKMVANAGWISMLGTNYGATLDLQIPCQGVTADVSLAWDFNAVAWPGKPPSIEIDVPAQVSCTGLVDLDATATDANSDIESVRWLVDGVLMDASVTEVDFTSAHTLTAIVRDERGATDTDTEVVTCQ